MEDPAIWNDQNRAQAMAKEKGELENVLNVLDGLATQLEDAQAMLDLAVEADEEAMLEDVQAELSAAEEELAKLEFRRMFNNQWTRTRAMLKFRPVLAVPKHKTGLQCYCVCICAGLSVMALRPS